MGETEAVVGKQESQELLAVHRLLNNRLETIPWHVSNVGPELEELRTWEHRSLLKLLRKGDQVFCAYDTLGILTHLCLSLKHPTVYHSVRDLYSFAEVPKLRLICDPLHMPPKHEFFYHDKYDVVMSTFLFSVGQDLEEKAYTFLATMARILKPGGRLIVSYCASQPDTMIEVAERIGMFFKAIESRSGAKGHCGVLSMGVS